MPTIITDDVRFQAARSAVLSESVAWDGIGTLSEKSLHKMLKLYLEPNIENHEVAYMGSIVDIKTADGIFEVQTRGYDRLVPKLRRILPTSRVTVVCPLAHEKYMRWLDRETGEMTERRKSPKRENAFDAFRMLFGIRELITHPNLHVRLVYMQVEDFRALDGWDKTHKRGSNRVERIPTRILREESIDSPSDYLAYLPDDLGDEFTAPELSRAIKRTSRYTFYVLKLLEATGTVRQVGKRGRAALYSICK
jgi:hypothetical protein